MKKYFTAITIATVALVAFFLGQVFDGNKSASAETPCMPPKVAIHMQEKQFNVQWYKFKAMANGEHENRFEANLTWNPIETNVGMAEKYRVEFTRPLEDGKLRTYSYTTTDTSYTITHVLNDGVVYNIKITPIIGSKFYKDLAIEEEIYKPYMGKQVSPVKLDQYIDEKRSVLTLLDNLYLKQANDTATEKATDGIRENLAKIYVNSGYVSSTELINNRDKMTELFERAELRVKKYASITNVSDAVYKEVINELLAVYEEVNQEFK